MMESLERLKIRGFSPSIIVDVGAAKGEWTRSCRTVFADSHFIMIEPNPVYRTNLARVAAWSGAELHEVALGATSQTLPLFVPDDPAGSSLLGEHNPEFFSKTVDVPVVTLESILDGRSANLIKLDVQGYELEVLKGAGAGLSETDVIIAECSLYRFEEGVPLFHEVVDWMAQRGFMAYEFAQAYRLPSGDLAQVDVMFLAEDSPLRPNL